MAKCVKKCTSCGSNAGIFESIRGGKIIYECSIGDLDCGTLRRKIKDYANHPPTEICNIETTSISKFYPTS